MAQLKMYISGKITGLPISEAKAKFREAEIMLRKIGVNPVNPFTVCEEIESPGTTWAEYMVKDIEALLDCEAIFMLKNWGESKGARVEYAIAQSLGLKIWHEYEMINAQNTQTIWKS